jgi:hypothetical protein
MRASRFREVSFTNGLEVSMSLAYRLQLPSKLSRTISAGQGLVAHRILYSFFRPISTKILGHMTMADSWTSARCYTRGSLHLVDHLFLLHNVSYEPSISFACALMPAECALRMEQLGIRSGPNRFHLAIHLPQMQGLPGWFKPHANTAHGLSVEL